MYKRRADIFSTSFNIGEKVEVQSPYKNLEESLPKPSTKASTKLNHHNKSISSSNQLQKAEFDKRLEQIKKKYISPSKATRNTFAPMSSIDLNIPSATHRVFSRDNSLIKEKEPQYKNNQPRLSDFQTKKPILCQNSYYHKFQKQSTPTFEYSKRGTDDQRIRSINKINDRIKTMLQINQTKKTTQQTQSIQKVQENVFNFSVSENTNDIKQKKSIMSTQSSQKDTKDCKDVSHDSRLKRMNKSYLDSYKDSKSLAQEFDNRMQQIQERIKKSEENRMKIMSNYQPIQPSKRTPTVDKKEQQNAKQVQAKERSNSGLYSHRYMDFGKNVSRNIIQQLKSFEKPHISTQSRLSDRAALTKTEIKNETKIEVKTEIPRLISTLVQQITLDEQARNGKACFQSNNDASKWSKLKDILSRKGKKYSQQQIKQMFTCSQGDHNPFYICEPNESIQSIVKKYLDSQQHWKSKVLKKFDVKKLKQEGFKNELLDLELKGYLQIEDLVRYLNIETGKFYRNRDLITIFKRITKINKIPFEQFVKTIEA